MWPKRSEKARSDQVSEPSDESMPESVEEETPWAVDAEAPMPDVAEQRREVVAGPGRVPVPEVPLEADPADAIDQQRVVNDLDEEFR
jgi:hypothetical protein